MIRTLFVWVAAAIITFGLSFIVVLASIFRIKSSIYDTAARTWGRWILKISGTPVILEGLENVRLDVPQIFVSNHVSWFDVFALAAYIPKRYRFVAKEELGRIPIFGQAWKAAGHISVNRSDRAQAVRALEDFGRLIREDKSSIVIFPEGTRSKTGELLPFKKGAFMLALHTHVDIVPVAVLGTRDILPKSDWRVKKRRIIVRYGEAIPTTGYTEANRNELIALVRGRIEELLSKPVTQGKG